jgi:hypothetical protein
VMRVICVAGLPLAPALERGLSGVSNKFFSVLSSQLESGDSMKTNCRIAEEVYVVSVINSSPSMPSSSMPSSASSPSMASFTV